MRIAIDATAMPANRAGAGVYTYQLARALADTLGDRDRLLLLDRWGAFDSRPPQVVARRVVIGGRGQRLLWEQSRLPALLARARVDVFHSPHHSMPAFPPCPSVVTVHDVTFRLLPWRYTRARRWYMHVATAISARRAQAIIVPATSVKRDFLRLYGGDAARVHVIAEAAAPHFRPAEDPAALAAVRSRYHLPERFLLSVGTREPGKNRQALLTALEHLARAGRPEHLVIAGQRGWGPEDQLAIGNAAHGRIHLTGYVPDADLPALYALASAFIFPSWREGFGLPPLEAMACGTPVVASDRPAMPEVLGDAALYAPPDQPQRLAEHIERVLTDAALAERLREAGLARAALYSWQRSAAETLAVYQRVAGRAPR